MWFISSLLSFISFHVSWILTLYKLFDLQLFSVIILLFVYNIKDFLFQITIFFYYPYLWYQSNKSLPNLMSLRFVPHNLLEFYSLEFYFQPTDQFPLIFVCGFDNDPILTFCRWMDVQFAQYCLVKVLSFLPWMVLVPFWKIILPNRWEFTSEWCCIGFMSFFILFLFTALP